MPSVPPPPPASPAPGVACTAQDVPSFRASAFLLANLVRFTVGVPQVTRLDALDTVAQAHARYEVTNGQGSVGETPGLPCFTGADPAQRLAAMGITAVERPDSRALTEMVKAYEAPAAGEVEPWDVVSDMLHYLYSRMSLLDPRAEQIGLGFAALPGTRQRALVIDSVQLAGTVGASADTWAVWPRDGTTGLPTRMRAAGLKPLGAGVIEGYPVSLHAAARVEVSRFVMTVAADGSPVSATVLTSANDPHHYLVAGEAALVPHAPLAPNTRYRIELDGMAGTMPLHLVWSFTTGP